MPWSGWLVAGAFAAIATPFVGDYVALILVFAPVIIFVPFIRALENPVIGKLVVHLVSATGIDPINLGAGFVAVVFLGAGLICLVLANRQRSSSYMHGAILLLAFMPVWATAFYRFGGH